MTAVETIIREVKDVVFSDAQEIFKRGKSGLHCLRY